MLVLLFQVTVLLQVSAFHTLFWVPGTGLCLCLSAARPPPQGWTGRGLLVSLSAVLSSVARAAPAALGCGVRAGGLVGSPQVAVSFPRRPWERFFLSHTFWAVRAACVLGTVFCVMVTASCRHLRGWPSALCPPRSLRTRTLGRHRFQAAPSPRGPAAPAPPPPARSSAVRAPVWLSSCPFGDVPFISLPGARSCRQRTCRAASWRLLGAVPGSLGAAVVPPGGPAVTVLLGLVSGGHSSSLQYPFL